VNARESGNVNGGCTRVGERWVVRDLMIQLGNMFANTRSHPIFEKINLSIALRRTSGDRVFLIFR